MYIQFIQVQAEKETTDRHEKSFQFSQVIMKLLQHCTYLKLQGISKFRHCIQNFGIGAIGRTNEDVWYKSVLVVTIELVHSLKNGWRIASPYCTNSNKIFCYFSLLPLIYRVKRF